MRLLARSCLVLVTSLVLAASAQAQPKSYAPAKSRSYAGSQSNTLTPPSTAAPEAVVAQFLRDRGIAVSAASLVRASGAVQARNGIVVYRLQQTVAGLRLYGVSAKAAFTDRGELVHLVENFASGAGAGLPGAGVTEDQALRRALGQLYPGQSIAVGASRRAQNAVVFARTAFFHAEPRVTRVAYVAADGSLNTAMLVETWSEGQNHLDHTLVGAGGAVLHVENRTNDDNYNVFLVSPRVGAQTVVAGPGSTTESPAGWLGAGPQNSIEISGNNVHSYLDAKSNNTPDAGGVAVVGGAFVTPVDLTQEPSTPTNRDVSVQNLFFLNNRIHDILYDLGFTEAAGNFQSSNFGRGGLEGDPVNAEAQDGRGANNANFATPPDGSQPRMQMFLFDGIGEYEVVVSAPASVAGTYKAFLADFGSRLRKTVSGPVVGAVDAGGVSPLDGCEALDPAAVAGKIAIVDRGTCTFVVKAQNAEAAGAIGLLIANNRGGTDIEGLGGTDRTISIPVLMISQNDGATLRGATGVAATLQKSPTPPLKIDSALDSDVVYHEYSHGLTWRMIGGMSGPIAGALGEGASDVVAILVNGDDRVGEYSGSSSLGFRTAPYATYPNTYADITGTEVHADGELYAAIMWRLATLMGGTPEARQQLLTYFVDAMNFIPETPGYEDMRAGLLQAVPPDLTCSVWSAFASYGVGEGSSATITGKGKKTAVTITESFALPASCAPTTSR